MAIKSFTYRSIN